MQKYIYPESLFNTLYIEIKHKYLKNISSEKIKVTKNVPLFSFASSNSSYYMS